MTSKQLVELEKALEKKGYEATYVEINNKTIKQNRVYLDLENKKTRKFIFYFAVFEGKLFLYVFLNRPYGFDYTNFKQTEEEKKRCLEAKFGVLKLMNAEGIKGIEQHESIETVSLFPRITPKMKVAL